jgi:suppressor for copper-sensitivity B
MSVLFRRALLCLLWLWLPASWAADSGWLRAPDNQHASVRLRTGAPQGENRVNLLLDIKLEKGWKTYWRSPGEGGVAPSIRWNSDGINARWQWPTPHRFDVAGITTQGYKGDVTLPIELQGRLPGRLSGVLTLSTCSNVCILTDYPFQLDLTSPAGPQFAHDYARALGQVPPEQGLTRTLNAGYRSGELVVTATRDGDWRQPELFLDNPDEASFGEPDYRVEGSRLTATVPVSDSWGDEAPDLRGHHLSLVLADGDMAQQSQLTVGEAGQTASGSGVGLWQGVLAALLGGFILNLMPCVLPVLGMKLGSVLQAQGQSRRQVRRQFIASAAGIVVSFLALALMMTLLRLGNQALGWGVQFQSPWFIGGMALVMALFSASLFGLFELRLSSGATTRLATWGGNGTAGHFWQGVFATLLATPCTAPFLGTALALALAAPLPVLWGIFLALGIGMSLPWLLIAAWPTLALRLPRPGRWMNVLRTVLGLMMLGSALWLLSLLALHIGRSAALGLGIAVLVLLLAAIARRYGWRTAGISASIAVLLVGGVLFGASLTSEKRPLRDEVNWQPLSEQAIRQALADNKRVFVDVTADWCVTCKANKYNVLLRDETQKALKAPDVVALRGDWSRPSAEITAFLNRRGSVAVPFNQVYGPGLPQGKILPALLSREDVLNALSESKGKQP